MHEEYKYCDGCLFCDDHKCDTCPFNWKENKKEKLKVDAFNALLVVMILILFIAILLISLFVLLRC